MFVWGVESDTKGLMYARSLQQLFVGIYLAQLCMIGLFAIGVGNSKGALGPLILMIILLVITALYHISLNAALSPLLKFLPKTLETEEERLLAKEAADDDDAEKGQAAEDSDKFQAAASHSGAVDKSTPGLPSNPAPLMDTLKGGGFQAWRTWFVRWLRPDIYADYYAMRKLVPRHFVTVEYDESEAEDAYLHPSIRSEPPLLWVPRDEAGVSTQEVRDTGKVINITDEGARLTDKGDIVWDVDHATSAPIYEKPVFY
jgi:hypothetical protein